MSTDLPDISRNWGEAGAGILTGAGVNFLKNFITLAKTKLEALAAGTELADLAVVTAKIDDLAVTAGKIAAGAVTTAKILAGNVTLPKISFSGIKVYRFDGKNGTGAITLTGAVVGDRVIAIFGVVSATGVTVATPANFESTITVNDQIQQSSASDLSGNDYIVLLAPATA